MMLEAIFFLGTLSIIQGYRSDLETPIGIFKGDVATSLFTERQYVSYMSIPYAMPPVGDLRFARPVSVLASKQGQVVNEQTMTQSCLPITENDTSEEFGEDCLYLNIYSPFLNGSSTQNDAKYPVMVWIHGGGFVLGQVYPEPIKLATRGQVIIVTIKYRLGVFGFLTTLSNDLPSNNGLWDQYLAIKWVSDNIRYFNGDENSITVFGESAGATSVLLQTLSPIAAPLFHKIILQSYSVPFLISKNPLQRTDTFARLIGCGDLACLRNASVADILAVDMPSQSNAYGLSKAQRQFDFLWLPVVDEEFVMGEPLDLIANQSFLDYVGAFKKDYIIGINNGEGSLVAQNGINPLPLSAFNQPDFFNDLVDSYIPALFDNLQGEEVNILRQAINNFYVGKSEVTEPINALLVFDLTLDVSFFIPAIKLLLAVSKCSADYTCQSPKSASTYNSNENCSLKAPKIYSYYFDACPQREECLPPCMWHGDDIPLEFPVANFTDLEFQSLSDMFVDILTTFAATSDPGKIVSSGWAEFEPVSRSYLSLSLSPSVRTWLRSSESIFWLERIPELIPSYYGYD